MSRRLGEIEGDLGKFGGDTLTEAERIAQLTPAELEERDRIKRATDAEAKAEQRRQDARDAAAARIAEIQADLEAEQKKLDALRAAEAQKVAAVKTALNERTALTDANYTAVEERTRTHIDTMVAEFERLRAAQNGATSSPATNAPAFASGGAVYGPGTGTSDEIHAKLSHGEHVLTAADVRAMGGHGAVYAMRDAIRSGLRDIPKFAEGGPVTSSTDQSYHVNLNQTFHGDRAWHMSNPNMLKWHLRVLGRRW